MLKIKVPSKSEMERQVWSELRKGIVKEYEGRLRSVTCDIHQQNPRVVVSGTLKHPDIRIEGCCQSLIERAVEAMKE